MTGGSASSGPGRDRLLVLVLHVQVDQVIPVPPVDRENDQNEEIRGEGERFDGGHARMTRARHQTDYIAASRKFKKRGFRFDSRSHDRSELQRLLDDVRRGDDRSGTRRRPHPRGAARGAVRGPRLRARRYASRRAAGLSRSHPRPGQDAGTDRRHRRAHRRARTVAARHARARRRRSTPCATSCPAPTYHDDARAITLKQGEIAAGHGTVLDRVRRHVRSARRRGGGRHRRAHGQRGRPPLRRRRRRPPSPAARTRPAAARARAHRRRRDGRRAAERRRRAWSRCR